MKKRYNTNIQRAKRAVTRKSNMENKSKKSIQEGQRGREKIHPPKQPRSKVRGSIRNQNSNPKSMNALVANERPIKNIDNSNIQENQPIHTKGQGVKKDNLFIKNVVGWLQKFIKPNLKNHPDREQKSNSRSKSINNQKQPK